MADENSREVGKYCGVESGKEVFLFGKYTVLTFHTDADIQRKGFKISFSHIELSKYSGTAFVKTSVLTKTKQSNTVSFTVTVLFQVVDLE